MPVEASLVFLTPAGGLVALAVLLPLAAAAHAAARTRRARASLGLEPPRRRLDPVAYVSLAAVVLLLALAATQPALARESAQRVRTDAQALFVLDVSRSMAAARRQGAPTRLERARVAARKLRASIPEVEAGVATLTDRVLPDLMPVADSSSFDRTLDRSVQIEEPPPRDTAVRATTYAALADVPAGNYFVPAARKRVVVLLTDGETQPIDDSQVARALASGPGISLVSVRFWNADETIRDADGKIEAAYRPDPTGALALEALASATNGETFDEHDLGAASTSLRNALGAGSTRAVGVRQRDDILLGPYVALLALVPLVLLVIRREKRAAGAGVDAIEPAV